MRNLLSIENRIHDVEQLLSGTTGRLKYTTSDVSKFGLEPVRCMSTLLLVRNKASVMFIQPEEFGSASEVVIRDELSELVALKKMSYNSVIVRQPLSLKDCCVWYILSSKYEVTKS